MKIQPTKIALIKGLLMTVLLLLTSISMAIPNKIASEGTAIPVLENVKSKLEIIDVKTGMRRIIYQEKGHFEAPNWSTDGQYILFNKRGRLYKLTLGNEHPQLVDSGTRVNNNNDHGFSPDGKFIAISDQTYGASTIATLPVNGGEPNIITTSTPSYWHGWSPDGRFLAFCGERKGNYDIFIIPANGGKEKRLTATLGLDDGPDYAPDGTLYFNSVRSGLMKIWKMGNQGENQQQVTSDKRYADWFPHPSPDGKHLVFLSYDSSVSGHPANKSVVLRIMPLDGSKQPRILTKLFGGQGIINVPSWSPDSKKVAFVSYELIE